MVRGSRQSRRRHDAVIPLLANFVEHKWYASLDDPAVFALWYELLPA